MTETLAITRSLINGETSGTVLNLEQSLSFWGGIDPQTGLIIDNQHPQRGQSISQTLLVLPGIRGSTAGSGALLECLYAGHGPSALLLCQPDTSAIIAATVYQTLTGKALPIVEIPSITAAQLENGAKWRIEEGLLKAYP